MAKLTDLAVKNAKPGVYVDAEGNTRPKANRLHVGDGLTVLVKPNGSKFWVLRVMKDGKRVDLGLGRYPGVSLLDARAAATALRGKAKAGDDVLAEKRAAAAKAKEARELTFEVVARLAHEARKGLAAKTNALWLARLEQYAFPAFGKTPVEKVDGQMAIAALEPVWHDKPETARRLRRAMPRPPMP